MLEELKQLEYFGFSFKAPDGGLSIWVRLPPNCDSIHFYEEASKRDVALVPGNVFFIEEEADVHFIRLSFSAVDENQIKKGFQIIKEFIGESNMDEVHKYMPFL